MQPCECLTTKEMQVATLVWEGLTNRHDHWNLGAGRKKLAANHVRQTWGLEPTGTGAVCRPARRCSLAGYTEHAFAIRFAAGPTWCFAAAGLRIRFLRQIRAAGFMTCDSIGNCSRTQTPGARHS
jgi:hypothetical protein